MTTPPLNTFSRHARIRARRSAVQALYQWQMTEIPMADVIREFESDRSELKKADKEYFSNLLHGTTTEAGRLDEVLLPLLDRPLKEIDPVEQAILHIGMYELLFHPELPWRVIVNESVELAKMFGADQSHKYVNGILDKAARQVRRDETTLQS